MASAPETIITKSDFLLYCESPRHLWAKRNRRITQPPSEMDRLTGEQGYQVEALAHDYLERLVVTEYPEGRLSWQATFRDGPFEARVDALLYKPGEDAFDLFEIKSSTAVDNTDLLDVAFQAAILERHVRVVHYYLLHLNKEYLRQVDLDLDDLFSREDVTEKVAALLSVVKEQRLGAVMAAGEPDPNNLVQCLTPRQCPCPELCFPVLPDFSIFDIPRLGLKKKQILLDGGILAACDVPEGFDLNELQNLVVERAKTGRPYLDHQALQAELGKLVYPIYFLDYETCLSAIPQFEGYHPQEQIVFQYSVHWMSGPDGAIGHAEHISTIQTDPGPPLVAQLSTDIGPKGSVLVWNKTFEISRNREMARRYPRSADFLEQLNRRIEDLGDVVSKGIYLHPGFKGSWSIKNVLPVMAPDLSYDDLAIHQGDQASLTWWRLRAGEIPEVDRAALIEAMLRYCERDTWGMVMIYREFCKLI